ncbi:hypothetical protein VTH06DRAFT_4882 [Thermothelomyces fergusii]
MPTIDVAMQRSLRRGVMDLFVASLQPALVKKDLAEQISDVKTAFSSWDNCMQVDYCKWTVFALIAVGGLIIIGVTWCIIRGRRKYLDEPYIPPQYGYKPQEPMHAGFNAGSSASRLSKGPGFPQYAEFDVGGKKDEDALPKMPTWEDAEHKKVLVEEEEAVEMDTLKRPGAGGQAARPVSPHGSRSPVNRSPYGPPGSSPGPSGYQAASTAGYGSPYAQDAPAYNQPGMAYGQAGNGYGAGGFGMGSEPRSPQAFNGVGYGGYTNINNYGQAYDHPDSRRQQGYDNYGAAHQQPYDSYGNLGGPQTDQGYGIARYQTPSRELNNASPYHGDSRRSPAPQDPYGPDARRSPVPQQGPYGGARSPPPPSPQPQQHQPYSNNGMHLPVGGGGGFGSTGPTPLRNEAGFDFTSGYSRPPAERSAAASPVNGPGGYGQLNLSADFGGGGGGYSGYQSYNPA